MARHGDRLPTVTILIPARNEERHIAACLDSLIGGNYPEDRLEILVLDGSSKDSTTAIVRQYADRYDFIRILNNPKRSIPAAMNIGIGEATGDVVMKADAHSIYPRDYVRKCASRLYEHDAANVGGRFEVLPSGDRWIARCIALASMHPLGTGRYYRWLRSREGPTEVETVSFGCFRKEFLEQRQLLFNENLHRGEDIEFNARLKRAGGKILVFPDIVFTYLARPDLRTMLRHQFHCGFWAIRARRYGVGATWRAVAPLVLFIGALGLAMSSLLIPSLPWLCGALAAVYGAALLSASFLTARAQGSLRYFVLMPIVLAGIHVSHSLGSTYALLFGALTRVSAAGSSVGRRRFAESQATAATTSASDSPRHWDHA